MCSHTLESTPIRQLPKDRVDEIANSPQDGTFIGCGFGRMSFAKRSLQENASLAQASLQVRQPVVPISQYDPISAFQQRGRDFAVLFIGTSQEQMGDQPRPAQARMQPEPIKGLSVGIVFVITCGAAKANAPRSTGKTIDQHRHTINNANQRIIANRLITQLAPEAFLDAPQIGGLSNKGTSSQLSKSEEKVRVVLAKVLKQLLVLRQTQVAAHDFHRENLAIRQFWHGTSLPKSLSVSYGQHHLVNSTKTCDNKVVQLHEGPLQSFS